MNEHARWRAVLDRDRRLDGAFVFAVRTTRIYCRPSCPSRRPRRDHVAFFTGPDEAEQAGFRDCRRCHPRTRRRAHPRRRSSGGSAGSSTRTSTSRLGSPSWEPRRGMSPHHLQRTFKQALGITPRQYADGPRVEALKSRLKEGWPVTQAIYEAGYGSSSRLYEKPTSSSA